MPSRNAAPRPAPGAVLYARTVATDCAMTKELSREPPSTTMISLVIPRG